MDNLYFKKLPSEVLPTVSGTDVVLAETASGKLFWCDSAGAKRLLSFDEQYAVGDHYIQFYGQAEPAEKFPGSWVIDTDYAGRTIIGSGGSYTFGATGGNSYITLARENLPKGTVCASGVSENNQYQNALLDTAQAGYKIKETLSNATGIGTMPPYFVQNIWKRIA